MRADESGGTRGAVSGGQFEALGRKSTQIFF